MQKKKQRGTWQSQTLKQISKIETRKAPRALKLQQNENGDIYILSGDIWVRL